MLLNESLLVLSAATREYLEEAVRASDRGFHKFHPYTEHEKADEVDRGDDDQEQDAPHRALAHHEWILPTSLVVQAKVDDRN